MKATKILLLLAILVFGGFIEAARVVRGQVDLGPTGCRVLEGRFRGPSFTFESEQRHAVPPGTALDVQNAFGAVRVSAGPAGEVVLKLRTVVYRPTEEEARRFSELVKASAELSGTALRVTTNRDQLQRSNERVGFETHLELLVPADTAATVRNEHGLVDVAGVAAADVWGSFDAIRVARIAGPAVVKGQHGEVWVSGVQGALSLTARHGPVEVEDVGGRASLDTEHGRVTARRTGALILRAQFGEIEAETVRGDLEIRSQHGRVDVRDVTGNAVVETSYGDVAVAQVGGEARATTQHGHLDLRDVKAAVFAKARYNDVSLQRIGGPVDVNVDHGAVQAEELAGGGRIEASGNDVVVDGFRGPLAVQSHRGGVRLVPSEPVQWPLTVTATHGGIRLEVPAGSRFDLEAQARRGELTLDVPGLTLSRTDDSHVTGRLGGGGEAVKLTSENGDVRLEARVEVARESVASPSPRP
ncbi:MAG TPA: DUF4097 family beta strand repeat-containing protein [Vicinamibacteria bacterium]